MSNVDVDTALSESNTLMRESLGREDFKEGVQSYIEKRPPAFPGRVSADMPDLYPWWKS